VTVTATAVLALVVAYWTWQWFAPLPVPRVQAAVNVAAHAGSAGGLFGTPEQNGNKAAPTGIAIRLLGIVAATPGRRGYAVVQLEPKQILTVQEGDEIASGIRLTEVDADHLVLVRGGARETLAWPVKNTTTGLISPQINK
jgi:general secretion pathway protein C